MGDKMVHMIWPDLDSTIYIHHVILFSISIASGPAMTERHPLRLSRKKKSFLTKKKNNNNIKRNERRKVSIVDHGAIDNGSSNSQPQPLELLVRLPNN